MIISRTSPRYSKRFLTDNMPHFFGYNIDPVTPPPSLDWCPLMLSTAFTLPPTLIVPRPKVTSNPTLKRTRLTYSPTVRTTIKSTLNHESQSNENTNNSNGSGQRTYSANSNDVVGENQIETNTQYQDDMRRNIPGGTVYFMAIANEFSMASLYRRLLNCCDEYGGIKCSANGSVLRVIKKSQYPSKTSEAFLFPYGCMVVWGSATDRDDFLSLVVEDALELRSVPAIDKMTYRYGPICRMSRDVVTLESTPEDKFMNGNGRDENTSTIKHSLERLSVSCALAQSIKLGAFETSMRATIENTKHLPEELATSGEITASRREISRLMGQLFLDRYRYHLSGDLLMTPAFFWENEQYLPAYKKVERYLEVRERGEILNKRVEVVQELYSLLGDELTHKNSMALEVAITVMIAFEIVLTLITLAKESIRHMFSACALFLCLVAIGWVLLTVYRKRKASIAFTKYSRFPHNPIRIATP